MREVPEIRVRAVNQAAIRDDGAYVVHWMTAYRRLTYNWSLERAANHARRLHKPLVIFEALRADYPWASDRIHRFVLDGMADNARECAGRGVPYLPYVEPAPGAAKGLLEALAARACVVVTDDTPRFFLPHMLRAAAARLEVRLEAVDGNGLLPLAAVEAVYPTAFAFRRLLQMKLPAHLTEQPAADPLARALPPYAPPFMPQDIVRRWPPAKLSFLAGDGEALAKLPIEHAIPPAAGVVGGTRAGVTALKRFLDERLDRYALLRNHPDENATSGFSPYLNFGYLGTHQVLAELARRERWTPEKLGTKASGKREHWWGMSSAAEAFLDQLVTWRELGLNFAAKRDDFGAYDSLPPWARRTLEAHAADPRLYLYTAAQLEAAATHDPIWNAAQTQLAREGKIHNYVRMLWGKKIIEWSPSPQAALEIMIELNNRYALDGRDPNSYAGICWCFGRYDRPWGPERPIFGTVRYMSSENAARKLSLKGYVRRYAP